MKFPQEITQLRNLAVRKQALLNEEEAASIVYHDIFDYPLSSAELIKWVAGDKVDILIDEADLFVYKKGLFYLAGREGLVLKRTMRKRTSKKKISLAKKASRLLSKLPTVRAIAVTGALAMGNADEEADIDLLIITQKGTLWVTRLLSLFLLKLFGFKVRRFGEKYQKDKLCLNMWLDESYLAWSKEKRNIYTAHEIAQATPLLSKNGAFDKFIAKNSWIRDYWPNAQQQRGKRKEIKSKTSPFSIFEPTARRLQLNYMEGKRTREVVTRKRALFHPVDWSDLILKKLNTS